MGLPFPLGTLPVSFNGTVWGGGFTLAYGTERWFTSVTTVFTSTSTSGDLDSKVNSTAVQPRIGLLRNGWRFWVGGMYLDTDETHKGIFDLGLPGLEAVPFKVELETKDNWNYAVGAGYAFNKKLDLSLEAGFGDRTDSLFNINYRF
jgi:long-subunit fatty acid transport protein